MQVNNKKKQDRDTAFVEHVEQVFDEKRRNRSQAAFNRNKPALAKYGMLVGVIVLIFLFTLSKESRVSAVSVSGNRYLSSSYISTLADVSCDDLYYTKIPFLLEYQLKKEPLLESVDVSWSDHGIISIEVTEKRPVGYRYDDEAVLLLADGSVIALSGEYLDVIADVPYITGFTDSEQTRLLCKALKELSAQVVASIAEIHQFALEYDDEAMKILMRTGGYYIGSYNNLDKLAYYDEIYASQKDHSQCIYGFDSGSSAASQVCPWNKVSTSVEYWKDEDGNVRKTQYGDSAVKHYYVDKDGNTAVDAAGNPIPIPIDETATEIIDPDFQTHYEAGYYATGVLVMP